MRSIESSASLLTTVFCAFCFVFLNTSHPFAQERPKQPSATEPALALASPDDALDEPHTLSAEEVAKQLANPNTPLASLTLKSQWTHWDGDLLGSGGMDSKTFLFQPNFPFPINGTDSIFLRPAFPYLVDQPVVDSLGNVTSESGLGDMGLDLAFGRTTKSGLLMVAGVVAGIPIGADRLSSDTWTLGPEVFLGKLSSKGVLGLFPSHQWDVSGPRETSLTSIQPIATYLVGGGWAVGTAGTITHNWESDQWTVPIQLQMSRTVKVGSLPLRIALEANYYVEQADSLGQDWMIGFNLTPVVPNVVAMWLSE